MDASPRGACPYNGSAMKTGAERPPGGDGRPTRRPHRWRTVVRAAAAPDARDGGARRVACARPGASIAASGALLATVGTFLAYSLAVEAALWWRPAATLRLNFYVLLVDQLFALALIHLTGGAGSALYLALPLIAALQSYYYGIRRGMGVALVSARRLRGPRVAHDRGERRGQRLDPHRRASRRGGQRRNPGRRRAARAEPRGGAHHGGERARPVHPERRGEPARRARRARPRWPDHRVEPHDGAVVRHAGGRGGGPGPPRRRPELQARGAGRAAPAAAARRHRRVQAGCRRARGAPGRARRLEREREPRSPGWPAGGRRLAARGHHRAPRPREGGPAVGKARRARHPRGGPRARAEQSDRDHLVARRADAARRRGPGAPAGRRAEDLQVIHRHAQRVARIAQGLLSFARYSSGERGTAST